MFKEHDGGTYAIRAEVVEEATLAEPAPSFEEFYGANFNRVFTALCLVTGDRQERMRLH